MKLIYLFTCLRNSAKGGPSSPASSGTAGGFDLLGSFRGKLFDLGRYPGTVPSRLSTNRVIGEVYRLNTFNATLEILDQYEGTRFRRKRAAISLDNGGNVTAWIYLYRGSVTHRKRILSGDYMRYLHSF
jgi:gamma-glutamylcyclotransferase (GGCT)/AIG2-like uncharacterized protein YtfP